MPAAIESAIVFPMVTAILRTASWSWCAEGRIGELTLATPEVARFVPPSSREKNSDSERLCASTMAMIVSMLGAILDLGAMMRYIVAGDTLVLWANCSVDSP